MYYKEFIRPASLEEAWSLYQKKSTVILAGTMWSKMSRRTLLKGLDLSELGLDYIEETPSDFRIGAYTTLREAELHPGLNAYTHGAMQDTVRHIVGVQFRNTATIGGSIWGRFGFSDLLTLFLALDCTVCLYRKGELSLAEFLKLPRTERDILTEIRIPRKADDVVYLSQRNQSVDFPVLNVVLARCGSSFTACVGARPMPAAAVRIPSFCLETQSPPEAAASYVQEQIAFGSNMRSRAEYRKIICGVLVKRGMETLLDRC